ncbi:Protein kinase alk2 [Phlyctochytrium bullatum]|nr:Protein kinase alk2 [Phlyctochytrium bullatum]
MVLAFLQPLQTQADHLIRYLDTNVFNSTVLASTADGLHGVIAGDAAAAGGKAVVSTAVAAATLLFLWWYWDSPVLAKTRPPRKGTPGRPMRAPGYVPVLGHAFISLQRMNVLNDFIHESMSRNGNRPMLIQNPRLPTMVVVNDPACVEHVLKTRFDVYDKGPYMQTRMHDVLGHGIFNVDGDAWKKQRKIAANIFNVRNFKEFVGVVFHEEMALLATRLSSAAAATPAAAVDLQDLFFRFTMDGFARIGFGVHLNTMTSATKIPFAVAFDAAQETLVRRFVNPFWDIEEAVTPGGFAHRRNVALIREFGRTWVRARRAEVADPTAATDTRSDLLTLFMREETEDAPLGEDRLVDYVLNFIIAGRDTTAQALSWTFLELLRNPGVMAELVEEIDGVLEDGREVPTYEEVKGMKLANAVFREALRLHPSVPKEMKQANRDDVLPDGTLVKKDMIVLWSPYAMGRCTDIWGPDASKFDPHRWLRMTHQPSPFDYPVFNAGPRVCLGKALAELEGVFVLVSTLRRFSFELAVDASKVTYSNSLTLPMQGGLPVRVTERRSKA